MKPRFPREFVRNPEYRTPPVAHQVPIAAVRDNVYVLTDGSLAAVWRVQGLKDDLATDREIAGFYQRLQGVLNVVPPGMQFKLLHRIHHNYRDLLDEHDATLDGTNAFARYVAWEQQQGLRRAMREGRILRSDNLIVLTYNPRIAWWNLSGGVGRKLSGLADDVLAQAERGGIRQQIASRYQQALMKFEMLTRNVAYQMEWADLSPQRMNDAELYELAWATLNPTEALKRPCPKIRRPVSTDPYAGIFSSGRAKKAAEQFPHITVVAPVSEREQLCVSDWMLGEKWVRIDQLYYAAISLRTLPIGTYPGLARGLASLGFECTVSLDAVMLQKHKELSKQWAKARSAMSKADVTLFEGATPDPRNQELAQEMKDEYLQLSAASQNPFIMRLTIAISAEDEQTLDERVDMVMSTLGEMRQAEGYREHYAVADLLRTTWAFSPISDLNCRKAMTSHIANMMPLVSRWEGSKRPVTLMLDDGMRLVKHDPFPWNQLNRNRTVCGKSGSGKSFATQLADVHPHAAREGTEILIIESGASFLLTTRCFGGEYVKLGPSTQCHINAFDLPPGFADMSAEDQRKELEFKYSFVKNLVLCMARLTDAESQMIAENVVGSVCQQTYMSVPRPRFRDFYRILTQYQNPHDPSANVLAQKLCTRLTNYVVQPNGQEGIYSRYFDTYTTFDSQARIICFDLVDVKNDKGLLDPMAMLVLLGLVYNRLMLRDGVERLVIIDEAWALIKQESGASSPAGDAINLFWREGRKLGAASCMITQNISDMHSDAVGRAVIGNSPIQYFLVHEPLKANSDAFAESGFSQSKIDRVYGLRTKYGEYSEILIKEGTEWGVVRLPSSGIKYWLATSDPKDDEVKKEYFRTYGQTYGYDDRVVVALLAADYPGGVHGAQRRRMSENEGRRYAEWWLSRFAEFSGYVERGVPVPAAFSMEYGG